MGLAIVAAASKNGMTMENMIASAGGRRFEQ
jgi:hypothetical protein